MRAVDERPDGAGRFFRPAVGASVLVALLAARTAYLAVLHVRGLPGGEHYRLELASLWLVAGVLLLVALRDPADAPERPPGSRSLHSPSACAAFIVLSILLYAPILPVGFLSDDFVLVDRAASWRIGTVSAVFIRPFPMAVWAIFSALSIPPWGFHLLSVGLHGVNAYLTAILASRRVHRQRVAIAAGLLMLTAPLAPEAVAWASGVFDVMSTSFVLVAIVWATRRHQPMSTATLVGCVAIGLAAMLSKETAIVLPLLLVLEIRSRGPLSRRYLPYLTALIVMALSIVAYRMASAYEVVRPGLRLDVIQSAFFGVFDSFALPLRASEIMREPAVALAGVGIVLGSVLAFAFGRTSKGDLRAPLLAAAWCLAAVIPAAPFLVVTDDLEASRYLYLATPGWALLLVALANAIHVTMLRRATYAAIVALVLFNTYALQLHLAPWREAARRRDRVLAAAGTDANLQRCGRVWLTNLPDSIDGAYILRNGIEEVLRMSTTLTLTSTPKPGCTFAWEETAGRFVIAK